MRRIALLFRILALATFCTYRPVTIAQQANQSSQPSAKKSACCQKDPQPSKADPAIAPYIKALPKCVDGSKFAADFLPVFTGIGVKAIKAAGQNKIIFVIDSTPEKANTIKDLSGIQKQIDAVVVQLENDCAAFGVELYRYPEAGTKINQCWKQDGGLVAVAEKTDAGCGDPDFDNRVDPTPETLNQWKAAIPGILSIFPATNGELEFVISRAPDPKDPARARNLEAIKAQIRELVDDLHVRRPEPFVVQLPPGTGNAQTIASALNNQIRNASISAAGDFGLVVTPSGRDEGGLRSEIQKLVNQLAVPKDGNPASVTAQPARLSYLRDNAGVATVLNNALPGLKAAAVGSDSIMLSAAIPDSGISAGNGDASRIDTHIQSRGTINIARRMITMMDQPHPQVSLLAWSLQLSRKEPNNADQRFRLERTDWSMPKIHSQAAEFNDRVKNAIGRGYVYLRQKVTEHPDENFDPVFAGYLRGQVLVLPDIPGQSGPEGPRFQVLCCGVNTPDTGGANLGYALGFGRLFSELSPSLMNMLLVVSASKNPSVTADQLIDRMEGSAQPASSANLNSDSAATSQGSKSPGPRWLNPCQEEDDTRYDQKSDGLQMECTRSLLHQQFKSNDKNELNPGLGRFRAAVADFLFQYKLMTEYPDEFDSYLEPQAASKLDAQMVGFVDAFERDLAVLNYALRDRIADVLGQSKHSGESYDYSGIVSVKVVAGIQALVETQTRNYFPATPPVTLKDFADALATAGNATQPKILTGNLSADAVTGALAGLAQVTPQKQTVSVGRELDMTVTPYTLSAADGAELDIEITSKENGVSVVSASTTGSSSAPDDLSSRVANHHVKSHVRLESLKLFELSALDSLLARGKAPWKPVDPYLEIPVLGQVVRIPRHPDLIRQRSIVFLSAVVVPTAADLAATPIDEDLYGSKSDPVGKHLHSFAVLSPDLLPRVKEYHRRILACLARTQTDSDGNAKGCEAKEMADQSRELRLSR